MQTGSKKIQKGSLLSKWLDRKKKSESPKGIQPRAEGVDIPLSLGQQRLFFLQQLYSDNPFYNYADAYSFTGNLDLDILIKSFELVVQRHEILRSNFKIKDGQPIQIVNDRSCFEISKHDLRNVQSEQRNEEARKIAFEEARKSFNLNEGSLFRVSVLWLEDDNFLVVMTMHHIIFDKWSMRIFLNESAENYKKLVKGEDVDTASMNIQYGDYSYWQKNQKADSTNLSYWKNNLENSLELLDLPTDFQRPTRPTFLGAYSSKQLPYELSKKLRSLCKETNTTLYVLLLSAYKVLLNRYTNETDILVGSPFTNRDKVELEKLIGFFNDTLILRSDLSGNPTFRELLQKVNQTTQDAFKHKNMPFETLVKTLKPERYLKYNPLFQVMFIYHDAPKLPSFGKEINLKQEPFDFGVTKFDLTLYISDENEKITSIIEYSKDIFTGKTIERMHGHFQNLLESIVESQNQKISDIPLITNEELDLFNKWNQTDSENTDAKTFVELFEKQVAENPEKMAVSFQNKRLNYLELNKQANSIANYLLKSELNQDKPIGLFVESSIEMIVGILGIMKAGFAYLPLDAEYPKDRIKYILEDTNSSLVLTQRYLIEKLPETSANSEIIEEIIESESSNDSVRKKIDEKDLAYVIYTSGSTGKPKGVAITHKNLVNSTSARFGYYEKQPKNFLLLSSFSFDSSVVGIFWTLSTGGNLVLTERRIEQDLDKFANLFESEKITHTLLLPTLYSTLLKSISAENFSSVETIIVAGETCHNDLVKEHFDKLENVRLYNEYGPTEATVWTTAHEIKREDLKENVPIGKPISNTKIYILDKNLKRVPIGVMGELYIGGNGVAKGYLNDSELTKNRFISNPFNQSERLYKTGDLCRFRQDGNIEFWGRKDNQVKLRGYRIELREIQEKVKQIPFIKDAVIKIEKSQSINKQNYESEYLLEKLEEIDFKEADEILKSIENLSDKEIDAMLD